MRNILRVLPITTLLPSILMAQTSITITPSPTNLIEITPAANGVTLTNQSDRTVVGLSLIWTMSNSPQLVHLTDSFMLPKWIPVIAPSSSIVVGPAGILPAPGTLGRQAKLSTPATFTLDAVLFEDGQIVGPNTGLLDYQISSRKSMALSLAATARAASPNTLESALAGLMPASPGPFQTAEQFNMYRQQMAFIIHKLTSAAKAGPSALDEVLAFLDGLPTPPSIHQ